MPKKKVTVKSKPARVKATAKTTAKAQKATVAFKVEYKGLVGTKILARPVKDVKNMPKGLFATIDAAKKDITTRIKLDTKKALDKVATLKASKAATAAPKAKVKAKVKAKSNASRRKVTKLDKVNTETTEN